MATVAVFNLKGGVGKTTASIGLAGAALGTWRRVLLLDADPVGQLRTHLRPETGDAGPGQGAWDGVDVAAGDTVPPGWDGPDDLVLIDCPPTDAALPAVEQADLVLVPVLPDGPSLEGLTELLLRLHDRPYAVMVNAYEDRRTARDVVAALSEVLGDRLWAPYVPRRAAVVDRRTDHIPLQLGSRRGLDGVREAYAALAGQLTATLKAA